jgi:hypothetical protein
MNIDKLKYKEFETKGERRKAKGRLVQARFFARIPTRRARRYTHLDVGRNKPARAIARTGVSGTPRLPEKLPLLGNCSLRCSTSCILAVVLTPLTFIHVGNAHLAVAGRSYSGLHPDAKGERRKAKSGLVQARVFSPFALRLSSIRLIRVDLRLNNYKRWIGSES